MVDKGMSGGAKAWKKHQKTGRQVRSFLHRRKAIVKNVRIYEEYHFLAIQESSMRSALRKCRERVESKLEDTQGGFRAGRSTIDQIFTLRQIFEKSWEYAKDVFACFVDLEKAYDRVPRDKLWSAAGV